jgi:hypothetical protein
MNRWRVGEDRGSKETDGCPLTIAAPVVWFDICSIIRSVIDMLLDEVILLLILGYFLFILFYFFWC